MELAAAEVELPGGRGVHDPLRTGRVRESRRSQSSIVGPAGTWLLETLSARARSHPLYEPLAGDALNPRAIEVDKLCPGESASDA